MKVTINLLQLSAPKIEYVLDIENNFTFLNLLQFLNKTPLYSSWSFKIKNTRSLITDKLNENLIDYIQDNQLTLQCLTHFTPKSSIEMTGYRCALIENGLGDTSNLNGDCPINNGPIGKWIGFGRGPTTIPKEEDNTARNLIFIKFNDLAPCAYNIHCVKKLVDLDSDALLIPHINLKINPFKFLELYYSKNLHIKVLSLTDEDIINNLSLRMLQQYL